MKTSQPKWSRRKFINTLTGIGAVMMLNPLLTWANNEDDRE